MSDTIDSLHEKINKNFPTDKEKCSMICTTLGCAANLTEFIVENNKYSFHTIPLNIQYSIVLTSANMMGLISDEVVFEKVDFSDNYNIKISEQSQEHIYRKMKKAIELITKNFKEMEAENEL